MPILSITLLRTSQPPNCVQVGTWWIAMNLLSLIALVALYASATPSSVNAATLNDPCAALSASALAQGNGMRVLFLHITY